MHEPSFEPSPFEQLLHSQQPAPASGVELVFYRAGWSAALAERERSSYSSGSACEDGPAVTDPLLANPVPGPVGTRLPGGKPALSAGVAFRRGAGLGLAVGAVTAAALVLCLGSLLLPRAFSPSATGSTMAAIPAATSDSGSSEPAAAATNRNPVSVGLRRGLTRPASEPPSGFLAGLLFSRYSTLLGQEPIRLHHGVSVDWIAELEPLHPFFRNHTAVPGPASNNPQPPSSPAPSLSVGTPVESLLKDLLNP